jgi:hypothetical protein
MTTDLRAPLLRVDSGGAAGIQGQPQVVDGCHIQRSVSAESLGASIAHDIMGDVDAEPAPEVFKKSADFGKKDLGYYLSFIFLVNQIYGPGVLAIPIVFKQAGIGPTVFMLVTRSALL